MRHTSIPHFPVTAWKGSPGYIKHCQKMPKIWVGQTTINGEKKRGSPYSRNKFCSIYSHLVICFCGWQRNYTWSMTKAKIHMKREFYRRQARFSNSWTSVRRDIPPEIYETREVFLSVRESLNIFPKLVFKNRDFNFPSLFATPTFMPFQDIFLSEFSN